MAVKRINMLFEKEYPDKMIMNIIDYREKGIYVVRAVPKKEEQNRNKWLDGAFSVDMKTFKVINGFQPMHNDPKTFFGLPQDRVIYKRP